MVEIARTFTGGRVTIHARQEWTGPYIIVRGKNDQRVATIPLSDQSRRTIIAALENPPAS